MTDFNVLLRQSLAIVNDGFQNARDEIERIVAKLSAAVKQTAGEDFAVEMSEVSATPKGTTFRIYFDPNSMDPTAEVITVAALFVPSKGYPVLRGTWNKSTNTFFPTQGGELRTLEDVEKFFADLLSNPESSLIQALGFALRRSVSRRG